MPKVLARNLTSKPVLFLTKVRTSCSHLVKTPFLLCFCVSATCFFDDFLTFLLPLQRRISVAFGSKNLKNQIKLRPSYTCVTITAFRTSCLVNEVFSLLFHLT